MTALARDATVLIHEATFENGMEEDAIKKRHSTTREALGAASPRGRTAPSSRIWSQRYPKAPVFDDHYTERTAVAVRPPARGHEIAPEASQSPPRRCARLPGRSRRGGGGGGEAEKEEKEEKEGRKDGWGIDEGDEILFADDDAQGRARIFVEPNNGEMKRGRRLVVSHPAGRAAAPRVASRPSASPSAPLAESTRACSDEEGLGLLLDGDAAGEVDPV